MAHSHDVDDAFFTPKEAGTILRIGRSALYEWITRRDLPHYRFGRAIRIKKTDLADFIEQGRVPSRAELDSEG